MKENLAAQINEARQRMWMARANKQPKPTTEQVEAMRQASREHRDIRKARQYNYRPVECTECGWRGRRGFNVSWGACPSCLASGHKIKFCSPKDAGKEPCHGN